MRETFPPALSRPREREPLHGLPSGARATVDQAAGLRRLFGALPRPAFVPLASNPHVAFGGVLVERLVAAFADLRAHTLVVDAAEGSPPPRAIAEIDLADAIEPLAAHTSVLSARGLPRRHVDARGCSDALLQALADAAPAADVVLLHAPAADLWRLFARRPARPIVLAGDHPLAVTHAYAALKLLALRARLLTHDLLLGAAAGSPRAPRIAAQLAGNSERFLGGTQRGWAAIDPAADADEPPAPALRALARDALLQPADAFEPAASALN